MPLGLPNGVKADLNMARSAQKLSKREVNVATFLEYRAPVLIMRLVDV